LAFKTECLVHLSTIVSVRFDFYKLGINKKPHQGVASLVGVVIVYVESKRTNRLSNRIATRFDATNLYKHFELPKLLHKKSING